LVNVGTLKSRSSKLRHLLIQEGKIVFLILNLYMYLLGAAFFICVVAVAIAVGGVLLMVGLMAVSSVREKALYSRTWRPHIGSRQQR